MDELKIRENIILGEDGIKKIVMISSNGQDKKGVRELERCINICLEKVYFFLCNKDNNFGYDYNQVNCSIITRTNFDNSGYIFFI